MRDSDYGAYIGDGVESVLLPNKYVPESLHIGDKIDVFVYTDSEDRPVATTLRPHAAVDEFACLKVKAVTAVGAFLDWGLEKDLLAPVRLQAEPMVLGQSYLVKVILDRRTNRAVASSKIKSYLESAPDTLTANQAVDVIIYDQSTLGFQAIVDGKYSGMLYHNQIFSPLQQGQHLTAYVQQVRDDGKIDLSTLPIGYRARIEPAAEKIIAVLNANKGALQVTAKNSTDEIQQIFQMSRKTFKKALGSLYKSQIVEISDSSIKLKNK